MPEHNVLVISALDPSNDNAVKYRQTIIDLVNAGHPQVIVYLTEATHCPEHFLDVLFGELIQEKGSAWFINSGIMIDADNETLKNQATDVVMAMLQSDMKNNSSAAQSPQIINKQNWQNLPVMRDRIATNEDVSAGNAVFNLRPEDGVAMPINMRLPQTAIYYHEDQRQIPVIIVQAEELGDNKIIGMYTLDGEVMIGALTEVDLVEPDDFFAMIDGEL